MAKPQELRAASSPRNGSLGVIPRATEVGQKYRFQVVSLPHTQTTAEYNNCAFAQLTRRFCMMMMELGHEVYLYSGEDNDTPCTEHITCITKEEQAYMMNVREPNDILREPFVHQTYLHDAPWWSFWNNRVIQAMDSRKQHKDFLCLIGGGTLFEPLLDVTQSSMIATEYAIGYGGVASRTHHGYGSSNWQHVVFGLERPEGWRGKFYDRWLVHYFDPEEFTYKPHEEKGDYFLYLGKLKEDKGVGVASRACQELGVPLILAGQGPTPIPYGEVRNHYQNVDQRRELLANARGLFVPSLYTEPFGMIAVEGLLSGTPIITTPWGGLGEINLHGITGYICNNLQEFVDATESINNGDISSEDCLTRGMRYDMHEVKWEYQKWFDDLYGLWDTGWDRLRPR